MNENSNDPTTTTQVTVPADPTDAMIAAALAADWECEGNEKAAAINVWHAMLAAHDRAPATQVAELREALEWYGQQVKACRMLTREGDEARQALDADGGKRARAALAGDNTPPAPQVMGSE